MSDYIQESELNRVNRTAYEKDVKVSDDLFRVLSLARKAYVVSGGLFDPTIGPLSQIWRAARRSGQLPDPQAVTAARATVGFDKVRLYSLNQSVRFLVPGVKLDLGGIGKGFACQEAIIVATKAGCESAMIEGGGDMFFSKAPPGESGWEVELPNGETRAFKNTALSTSGNETQFTEINGRRYAHIIDPRKGWGAESKPGLVWKSSSVIGKNGALVDAYATVLFLDSSRWFSLGRGYEYIEHQSLKFEKL